MESIFLCIFILLPTLIANVRGDNVNSTNITWSHDFPNEGTSILKYAKKAQKSVWETSQFFHRWNIGLSQSNLKKTVDNFDGTSQITKRTFYGKLSKFTAKAAGVLGTIGAIFSIIMAFMPSQESPELQLMRRSFSEMNEKLDNIASSVDEIKSIIPIETQKAAYKVHEDRITYGSSRLKECLKRLNEVACVNQTDCKRKRISIAENFVNDFDVRANVEAILRGSTQDGVFGEALLDLMMDSSRCDLPKINRLASGIAALILKGLTVANFRSLLTETDFDYTADSRYLQKALFMLENKRQGIEKSCLRNIDSWMLQDLTNSMKKATSDPESTNVALLPIFTSKYPWSHWHIITSSSKETPLMWPSGSIFGNMHSKSKVHTIQTIAWPAKAGKVNLMSEKISEMKKIFESSGTDLNAIMTSVSKNAVLKDQLTSASVIKGSQRFLMSFYSNNDTMKHVYKPGADQNPYFFQSRLGADFLLVYFKQRDDPIECTRNCHGNGDCFIFPYSNQSSCRCKEGYSGEECNVTIADLSLREDFNKLLSLTLKIPSISSLKNTLEDSRMLLRASLGDISEAITSLGNIISNKFETFGTIMTNQLEWHTTLVLYKEPLQNLKYLTSIYYKDNELSSLNVSQFIKHLTNGNENLKKIEDARCILGPLGIRKWVSDINYLIVGRYDDIFSSHRPLSFMVMDRLKERLCYPDYKAELDRAFRRLIKLQVQGYILWVQAHKALNIGAEPILVGYENLVKKQTEQLENMTCSIAIPNSVNLYNCTGGFYIHSKMDVKVICKDSFYPKEEERLWVKDIVSFSSQYNTGGSSANQVKGPPNVYPKYGDTVGAWKQAGGQYRSAQYLTVKFDKKVFMEEMRIYETYHGGAIKQIQVLLPGSRWMTIWETTSVEVISQSRIFSPQFEPLLFPTDQIKVAIDPSKANNYIGIDAIMMIGRPLQNGEHLIWATGVNGFTSQKHSVRYIGDVLSKNNPNFRDHLHEIHPHELEIKKTTESDRSASYLEMLLSFDANGHLNTLQYDKRDNFSVHIIKFPFMRSNIPSSLAYGVFAHTVRLQSVIFIKNVYIYETHNAGGVTAIEGLYFNRLWQKIWSNGTTENISGSRIFVPKFKMQTHKTEEIRITISPKSDGTFTEIDAVSVLGFDKIPDTCSSLRANSCIPCECDTHGAKSSICNGSGECSCNNGYYGNRCENRDCQVDQWLSWSNCPCGETPQRSRTRQLINNFTGNGKRCPSQTETSTCPLKQCDCSMKPGFYGLKCQNRDCQVSNWGAWNRQCTNYCPQNSSNGDQNRRRSVNVSKQGSGKACPATYENRKCGSFCFIYESQNPGENISPHKQSQFEHTSPSQQRRVLDRNLNTAAPYGCNDNISTIGNLTSPGCQSVNVTSLFNRSQRRPRSHGIRKYNRPEIHSFSFDDLVPFLNEPLGLHYIRTKLYSVPLRKLHEIYDYTKDLAYTDTRSPEYRLQGVILDISTFRLFQAVRSDKSEEKTNRPFIKVRFANKGIDNLNLGQILNHKTVTEKIPPYFKRKETPCIFYSYTPTVASKIYNYKRFLQCIDLSNPSLHPLPCDCSSSDFNYSPCGHVITGDLSIVKNDKLRELLKKGPKYRESLSFTWNQNVKIIMDSCEEYARRWAKKEDVQLDTLSEWIKSIRGLLLSRINRLKSTVNTRFVSVFKDPDVITELTYLQEHYVITPADKASNNYTFTCKKYYFDSLVNS
ncbi:hypothetical protein FSP39_022583 [Pinctada imbricata]|uniref:EGF-like domain-containing protein n=1 Tax=Pinctada imbricata TaxID=66713 RepID=A0AA89C2V6_PINIB|nr:hypothetical protein FSP39_022583 [Pinctada imbricata]